MNDITDPADCTDMTQVRAGVDDVDRQLVALLRLLIGQSNLLVQQFPDRAPDHMIGRTITSPGCEVDCEGVRVGEGPRKVKLCN